MRTKQKLAQTRAGQTRGLGSRSRRHRPPRERWEEARGGRRPRPTMEDPSPDDAGQKTVRRSRRAGRDEGGSRTLRRSAGGCTKRLGAAGTRGTMWKTASASPPSGGRPRLVADHTHKEPCTKTAGRGPVPFYPSPSRGVRFIYLLTVAQLALQNLDLTICAKRYTRCLPEAAATPPSRRLHTAGGAVCNRPLGGVAAASARPVDVPLSRAGDDSTPLRSEIKL